LPDPAAPATDATGEFVELYNPNGFTFDLAGYKLQTGAANTYSFTFKEGELAPGSYQAFYVTETKLTLSNSSGKARLLNPDGETVSETAVYGKALAGSSWMLRDGAWAWTAVPSPGAANGVPVEGEAAGTSKTSSKSSKTSSSKAKTSTAKPKAAKGSSTSVNGDYEEPAADGQPMPVSPAVLAVVGIPSLGYMAYEYRHDLGNIFAKSRRNRNSRSEAGAVPAGR
jgi:hypothetical protein